MAIVERYSVVGLDPGSTTGVAIFHYVSPNVQNTSHIHGAGNLRNSWEFKQLSLTNHHKDLYELLINYDPDYVVCESFEFRQFDGNRTGIVLDSREYIGVAKLYCQLTKKPLTLQTASVGKAFWTDAKLKKIGLWQVGQKHANDALRHVLYFTMQHLQLQDYVLALR